MENKYCEDDIITCYRSDLNQLMRADAFLDMAQQIAVKGAEHLNFGRDRMLEFGCAWVLAMIIAISMGFLKGIHPDAETWFRAFLILSMMFVILALMLPFQLKFGGERGRIVLIGCLALMLVIGGLALNGLELIGIDLLAMLDAMPAVNAGIMSLITLLIALLFLGVSCLISIGIVQKKEF